MRTQDMTISEIRTMFEKTNGRFFSAKFITKDNRVRNINATTKYKKHLKGGKSTISHRVDLFTVWSLQDKGFRSIPLDRLISARLNGRELIFNKELETT